MWAVRDVPLNVLGGNAKAVLYALISYADARGRIEVDLHRLRAAIDLGKTTLLRELDRLVLLGTITIVRRGTGSASSVYSVNVDHLQSMRGMDPASSRSQTPRGVSARESVSSAVPRSDSESWRFRVEEPVVPGSYSGGSGLGPIEDDMRIPSEEREDPASQAPLTSRSPEALRSSQLTGPTMPPASPTLPEKAPEAQKTPTPQPPPPKPVQVAMFDQEPPKAPKGKKGPSAFTRYREAFALGVQDTTKRPFAAPTVKGPEDVLVVALRAHARDGERLITGDDLLAWIRHHAALWAKQEREPEKFPYHRFVEWLNTGGHMRAQAKPEAPKRPAYVPLAAATPVAKPDDTDDFMARMKAHKPMLRAPIARVPS